jgi:hypothetical protein
MFLGAYHFDGDPAELLAAYERLAADFPPDKLDLHLCVVRDRGLTVYDACPTPEIFAEFSTGPQFRGALEHAGLPGPRIEPLGKVHSAHLRHS